MICPVCKKETTSIIRNCQNCNADLEEYRSNRNKSYEGTEDIDLGRGYGMESLILRLGPIGGIILMVLAAVWFFGALSNGDIYFYPPILFGIGVYGTIMAIKRKKKLKSLENKKQSGEIIE